MEWCEEWRGGVTRGVTRGVTQGVTRWSDAVEWRGSDARSDAGSDVGVTRGVTRGSDKKWRESDARSDAGSDAVQCGGEWREEWRGVTEWRSSVCSVTIWRNRIWCNKHDHTWHNHVAYGFHDVVIHKLMCETTQVNIFRLLLLTPSYTQYNIRIIEFAMSNVYRQS